MPAAPNDDTDTATLLWIDDQITTFGPHIESLEEAGYAVIAVATAGEALSTLGRGDHFDVILVDLKMPDSDGIALLAKLSAGATSARSPQLIVLSSFLYDPAIRRRLVALNLNVALLEKTGASPNDSTVPLSRRISELLTRRDTIPVAEDQFTSWDRAAEASSPFEITLETYLSSPMVVRLQLDKRAQIETRKARAKLAKKGVVWSCFCGSDRDPLLAVTDISEIPPDERLFALASSAGHPPYEFYARGEFEEHTSRDHEPADDNDEVDGCPGAPDYPFFRVDVVRQHDGNVSYHRSRDFHFDSGLDITAFDLEAALKLGLNVETNKPAKVAVYGEDEHLCYALSGDAYVDRGTRGAVEVSISGRAYLEWLTSPFARECDPAKCGSKKLCFRRHALLGRNVLVENELQLDVRPMGRRC